VARETLPVPKSGPAGSPEREKARLQSARALATQARLLCSAARLLDPKRAELEAAFKKLDELDTRLASGGPAPIDDARERQSACLRELTHTRRPATQKNPAGAATDTLLARLSDASLEPSRDDRGVVVTLRLPFGKDDQLKSEAKTRLTELAGVAKANPAFPVQVVVHSGTKLPPTRETLRADRAAAALREAGAPSVAVHAVGTTLPGLDPARSGGGERNERVEVVFVSPSAS
jgi:outer membrane protein OmpA-like peptidoglycan-associated protein